MAMFEGLTEKEACRLFRYALEHTPHAPRQPISRIRSDGRQRWTLSIPGWAQEEAREMLRRLDFTTPGKNVPRRLQTS